MGGCLGHHHQGILPLNYKILLYFGSTFKSNGALC